MLWHSFQSGQVKIESKSRGYSQGDNILPSAKDIKIMKKIPAGAEATAVLVGWLASISLVTLFCFGWIISLNYYLSPLSDLVWNRCCV